MGPSFVAFPDGRSLLLHDEAARDVDEVAKFSRARRRRGSATTRRGCTGVADVLAPLLLRTPPRVGSHRPGDLLDQLRMAWGLRGLDVRGTAEATRLFTMSIADVLDEWFESPRGQGRAGDQRRHRHVGRARGARHRLRDDAPHDRRRRRRPPRLVGLPDRRHGRRRPTPSGAPPSRSAPRCARRRRSSASTSTDGRVRGVTTRDGEVLRAPIVVAATHPQITFLRQIDRRRAARRLRRGPAPLALAIGRGEGQRRAVRAAGLPRLAGHRAARALHRLGRAVPLDRLPPAGVPGRPRRPGAQPGRSPTASSRRRSTRRSLPRAPT